MPNISEKTGPNFLKTSGNLSFSGSETFKLHHNSQTQETQPPRTHQIQFSRAAECAKNMISHCVLLCHMLYTALGQEAAAVAAEASKVCKGPADYQLINEWPRGRSWSSRQLQSASASKT